MEAALRSCSIRGGQQSTQELCSAKGCPLRRACALCCSQCAFYSWKAALWSCHAILRTNLLHSSVPSMIWEVLKEEYHRKAALKVSHTFWIRRECARAQKQADAWCYCFMGTAPAIHGRGWEQQTPCSARSSPAGE